MRVIILPCTHAYIHTLDEAGVEGKVEHGLILSKLESTITNSFENIQNILLQYTRITGNHCTINVTSTYSCVFNNIQTNRERILIPKLNFHVACYAHVQSEAMQVSMNVYIDKCIYARTS